MRDRTAGKLLALLVILSLMTAIALAQFDDTKPFIGNKNTKKYHTRDCEWGKRISPKNRVYFDTALDAEKAGYVACKICHPKDKN